MSSSDPFKLLRDNRAALLVSEAIGWLHMAGKARPYFLQKEASDAAKAATTWEEVKWPTGDVIGRFGTLPCIGQQDLKPLKLFKNYGDSSGGLLGLLQAAHAMASGVEKNHSPESTKYLKQTLANAWLTTAFGHPVQNLLGTSPPAVLSPGAWSNLEARIGALIDELAERVKAPHDVNKWVEWRNRAIGESGWLREAFTSTLAETRVPNNDVTLWDQSYIAAALFKAAAAGAVLTGPSFEWGNKSRLTPSGACSPWVSAQSTTKPAPCALVIGPERGKRSPPSSTTFAISSRWIWLLDPVSTATSARSRLRFRANGLTRKAV